MAVNRGRGKRQAAPGARIVPVAMRASVVRCLALGVLVAGVAAIVRAALGGDDAGDDSAASLGAAVVTTTAPPEPIGPEGPAHG